MIIDARRTGRTTALMKAAREIGAAFVVPTQAMKRCLEREHSGYGQEIYALDNLQGVLLSGKAVIYDHTVMEGLAREVEKYKDEYNNPNYKKIRELLKPLLLELDI